MSNPFRVKDLIIDNSGTIGGQPIGTGGGGISGLTTTVIPKATSTTTVGNSSITDDGSLVATPSRVGLGDISPPSYASATQNWLSNKSTTASDGLVIEDIVDNHTADFNTLHVHNSGTFDTQTVARTATGIRLIMDPLPTNPAHLLNNIGLYIDTNNGDTNVAIWSHHGTNRFDETLIAADMQATSLALSNAGPATIISVNTDKLTVDELGQVTSSGLMTLSNVTESLWCKGRVYLGGTTKGDTAYGINGSINKGYENNTTDTLIVNFYGYHQGFTQFRNFAVYDGKGNPIANFDGSTQVFTSYGKVQVGGTSGPTWTKNAGTPESTITGSPGDLCSDTTNGELYIKKTGSGNTGWKLVTHA